MPDQGLAGAQLCGHSSTAPSGSSAALDQLSYGNQSAQLQNISYQSACVLSCSIIYFGRSVLAELQCVSSSALHS